MNKCIVYNPPKSKYHTKERAEFVAWKNSTKRTKLHVYQCPVCNKWHLTKQKQKEKR